MEKITVYKEATETRKARHMTVNDAEGAIEALAKDGWTADKPKGYKPPLVVAEATIDSLTKQVEELTAANEELTKQVEELTAPPKSKKS